MILFIRRKIAGGAITIDYVIGKYCGVAFARRSPSDVPRSPERGIKSPAEG